MFLPLILSKGLRTLPSIRSQQARPLSEAKTSHRLRADVQWTRTSPTTIDSTATHPRRPRTLHPPRQHGLLTSFPDHRRAPQPRPHSAKPSRPDTWPKTKCPIQDRLRNTLSLLPITRFTLLLKVPLVVYLNRQCSNRFLPTYTRRRQVHRRPIFDRLTTPEQLHRPRPDFHLKLCLSKRTSSFR